MLPGIPRAQPVDWDGMRGIIDENPEIENDRERERNRTATASVLFLF